MRSFDPILVFGNQYLIKYDIEKKNLYAYWVDDFTTKQKKFDHINELSGLPFDGVLRLANEFAKELDFDENPHPTRTP